MSIYHVSMEKHITLTTEVLIEAPNADQAADMAQELAVKEMNGGGAPPWGPTDWSAIEDIQVVDEPWTEE